MLDKSINLRQLKQIKKGRQHGNPTLNLSSKSQQGTSIMNDNIKPQETKPNKLIVDIFEKTISDLYEICGIDLSQESEKTEEKPD